MIARDPRVDPRPGDSIFRKIPQAIDGGIIRDVTRAHGGFVFFTQDNGRTAKRKIVSLIQWRKWAAKAKPDFEHSENGE